MSTTLSLKVTSGLIPDNTPEPDTFQALLDLVARYVTIELDETVLPLQITGHVNLNPALSNVAITGDGGLGNYFVGLYQGQFRPFYTGLAGQLELFAGFWNTYFDSTGLGLRDGLWDGWALCNAKNRTVDLQQQFVIPGYRYADGMWISNVEAGVDATSGRGGSYGTKITADQLPALTYYIRGESSELVGSTVGMSFNGDPLNDRKSTYTINPGSPNTPLRVFPPFLAMGYAEWVGYS